MTKKIAIFAFRGELICFVHAMLHTLDLHGKGHEVKLIIEGTATKTIVSLFDESEKFGRLFKEIIDKSLISGVCKACAVQTGSLDAIMEKGLPIADDMHGHAGMALYIDNGYEIITL